jgi:ribosomal protein L30/L7E
MVHAWEPVRVYSSYILNDTKSLKGILRSVATYYPA